MAGNIFGTLFRITTFGESHGPAIGVVIDGCPAGLTIDQTFIQQELNRRRPGQSNITTPRHEEDQLEILSGVFEHQSTGAPITLLIKNNDQRPADYDHLRNIYRPSHADYTWDVKYGFRDYRGGGRSSARETAARVMAGAVAKLLLKHHHIEIKSYVSQVKDIRLDIPYPQLDLSLIESNHIRCPHPETASSMLQLIEKTAQQGDSIGGVISTVITGTPPGLGEPVFDKLHAELGKAMLSINACKGFEIGSGFEGTLLNGSEHNDAFESNEGKISTTTNHSGGVQGGISNGTDIYFRCAFKPVSTIKKTQTTINKQGEQIELSAIGRHDPCVLPRAVPIVEAMAALVLADYLLLSKLSKL